MKNRKDEHKNEDVLINDPEITKYTKPHITKIKNILKISVPKIQYCYYTARLKDGRPIVLNEQGIKEYKDDIMGQSGAIYIDETNTIYIAVYNEMTHEKFSEADIIYTIAHELRHVWQHTYEQKNIIAIML